MFAEHIRFFYKSFLPGHTALKDQVPWMAYGAYSWLGSYLKPHMTVFEYGSGGSTLFFSKRVKKVVSIEHDARWYKQVSHVLNQSGILNVEHVLSEPKQITSRPIPAYGPQSYTSARIKGMNFEGYVKGIEKYPDGNFDLVLIDGRARSSCIGHAINKVRSGGYLMLDDSDRRIYKSAMHLLKGYERIDFCGVQPYNFRLAKTSLWKRKTA